MDAEGTSGVVWRQEGGGREGEQGWECSSGDKGWEPPAPAHPAEGSARLGAAGEGDTSGFLGTAGRQTLFQPVGFCVLLWAGVLECVCFLECECSTLALSWFVFFLIE